MTQGTWFELYQAAMMEVDPIELRKKIDCATAAMHRRIDELANEKSPDAIEEQQKLIGGLHGLQTLRRLECQEPASRVVARSGSQESAQ